MVPGDGIGPELLNHIRELLRFCCVPVDFEVVRVDSSASSEDDINNAVTAIRRNGVALNGSIETKHSLPPSHKSRNNLLRENTEGEYSSLEHKNVPGVVECLKIITRVKSLRIAEYAFNLAREKGHRKVTAVHKANITYYLKMTISCCKEVAAGYPEITFDNMIVDPKPQQFVVMELCNLYESVVRNVCAGLVGGRGLVPGVNHSKDCTVFETATRNTGKCIANKKIANPTATLLASCLMLDQLKCVMIRKAFLNTVCNSGIIQYMLIMSSGYKNASHSPHL
uniref:Isopropylmalate dehydrogenase-like domain-containing protein n=2 Tax=Cyprinus carpio TaxID=7962 RepID=A0A8C1I0G8_CYPCA